MSLGNCIPEMVERGEIDQARAKRMKALFDQLEEHYGTTMGPEAAAAEASEETLRQLAATAALKKRQTLLQAARQKGAVADIKKYRGSSSYAAIRAMIDDDVMAPYANVIRRGEAIEFDAQAQISGFIERHRRNFLGKPKDRSGIDDVVREMHGQETGNARAKTFADALAEAFEGLRQRFNAAGGNIGKLKGWGFTHRHDALKVRGVSYDEWRGDLREGLDIAAMRDPDTGGPMTAGRLEQILRGSYEAIRTGGLMGEPLDPFMNQPKLANARAYHRTFVFKDGDAWLKYDRKYATGDPFSAIMAHIHGMSEDIAALERFGPNPDATVKYLLDSVDRQEAASGKRAPGAVSGASGGRNRTERLWSYVRGEYNAPVLAEGWLERPSYYGLQTLRGTRDMLGAAMLGSSPLSAISDFNTQLMTRRFNGLPQTKVLLSYLKQLNPASHADRRRAIRLGLGMRDASRAMLGLSRYIGESHGPEITSVIADDVLRLSGINKFTEAGQRAFGLDALGELGDHRGTTFEALPSRLREGLDRYGIEASDWEHIRAAEPDRAGRAEWVNPRNVKDRQAADRLMDYILGETAGAVQDRSASAQAMILAGSRPGTVPGEFLRNSFQFKSFTFGLMMQQANRIAALGPYRGSVYAAQFFVGMTLFGAASIQLREIAKGHDPRPMENAEFWEDAAMQGGGIGVLGDLLGAFTSNRVNSIASFFLGPMYSLMVDAKGAVQTALPAMHKDGSTRPGNPGRAAVTMAKRYLPGSNLWYARAAFEREILDRLSEETDPQYSLQRMKMEQWSREHGQGMWWAAGDRVPARAPDFSSGTGETPK